MNQDLDKIFNSRLKDASQPYPQGVWDKIQPSVPVYGKAKTKRPGWLWLSVLAILFISATVWTQLDKTDEGKNETASLLALSSIQNSDPSQTASELIQPIEIPQKSSEANESLNTSVSSVKADPSFLQSANNQTLAIEEDNVSNQEKTNLIRAELKTSTQIHGSNSPTNYLHGDNTLAADNNQTTSAENIKTETSSDFNLVRNRSIHSISLLSPASSALENIRETTITMHPDPNCYSFSNRHQSTYSADVYVGYGYGLRPMSSRDEDVTPYIDARKGTESYRYLFTAGVRLSMMMNNGLAFRGGLHYTQIGERFDYTDSSSIRIITIIDTTFVGGDTIVNPPQQVIQPGTVVKKINNRYHSLDIPLLLGYDVPLGRMHASLSAGAVINISAWQRGQFLDPSLEPANISVDEVDEYYPAYKTTLGVGAYLGASLAVPISKNIWVFGEPYILHRFDPVTFDEYSIKQGNTNFGINVGLKLKL